MIKFEKTSIEVRKTLMQGVCYAVYKGENRLYGVLAEGDCATFIVISLDKKKIIFSGDAPGGTGSWGVVIASDDRVYFGTYINAGLYRFDPQSELLEVLSSNLPGAKFIFSLDTDSDNNIYGGTWPNCAVFKYNGNKEKIEYYKENLVKDELYVRMVLYDEKRSTLYSSVSAHCHIIEFRPGDETYKDLLPEEYRKEPFARLMAIENDCLYVYMTKSLKVLVINLDTRKVLHTIDAPADRTEQLPVGIPRDRLLSGNRNVGLVLDKETLEVYYFPGEKDDQIMGLWPHSDGIHLIMSSFEGRIYLYNPMTGEKKQLEIDIPRKKIELRQLHRTEDGMIHSGGYLRGGNNVYDPETDTGIQYDGIGQCEGITSYGKKVYYGKYPGAHIYEYDTGKAWSVPDNPRELFELKSTANQDRPFAMEVYDKKLYIGTIPNYGDNQGALTIYDIATGTHVTRKDFSNGRSIVSFEYKNGILYGGTTVCGGLGSYTKQESGTVFAMDTSSGEYLYESIPVIGCKNTGGLCLAEDGMLMGCADSTFFIMDPADGKVVYTEKLTEFNREKDYKWEVTFIKKGPGKYYYIVTSNTLFRLEYETRRFELLENKKVNLLEFDNRGRLYCQYEENVREIIRSMEPVK